MYFQKKNFPKFRRLQISIPSLVVFFSSLGFVCLFGCQEKVTYKPEEAYKGPKADLPKPPTLPPASAFKDGERWTVYGVQHHLNHPQHSAEVKDKSLSIVGYVVSVYRPPVEPKGQEGCIYPKRGFTPTERAPWPPGVNCDELVKKYEPPHFFIAAQKDEKSPAKMIKVMGYASSYIRQAMARDWYKQHKIDSGKEEDLYLDNNYGTRITFLGEPKVGSKVVVSGQFGFRFQEGQGGTAISPWGIIDVASTKKGKIDCIEPKEKCEEFVEAPKS